MIPPTYHLQPSCAGCVHSLRRYPESYFDGLYCTKTVPVVHGMRDAPRTPQWHADHEVAESGICDEHEGRKA